MKTFTINELVELNKLLTAHALLENKKRAEDGLPMMRYRICPECRNVTPSSDCSCDKVSVH